MRAPPSPARGGRRSLAALLLLLMCARILGRQMQVANEVEVEARGGGKQMTLSRAQGPVLQTLIFLQYDKSFNTKNKWQRNIGNEKWSDNK